MMTDEEFKKIYYTKISIFAFSAYGKIDLWGEGVIIKVIRYTYTFIENSILLFNSKMDL